MNRKDLLYLIDKYLAGEASPEEISILQSYYSSFQNDREWDAQQLGDKNEVEKRMLSKITGKIHQDRKKTVILSLGTISKLAIAASILAILSLGTYIFLNQKQKKPVVIINKKPSDFRNDVLPGGDKALLTLNDGSTILLNDAHDGTLAKQGATRVIKLGGKLSYNSKGKDSAVIGYNTISTPRGGQYQVELPDGTLVWLNAETSIKFPTSFSGKTRQVDISGEAYFEVAHNRNMPFTVMLNGGQIQVLGTHFNVMAYADEEVIKTTLLQGSVKFSNGKIESMLKPGQQSRLAKDGNLAIFDDVDIEQTVAWKNGFFVFDNANLETVMRQLSRWYDVSVEYQNNIKPLFIGEMPRSSKLSDVLKVLELTGKIRFDIDGKKIIVQ